MTQFTIALEQIKLYRRAVVILLVLNLLDAIATALFVTYGLATEANPVMNACLQHGAHVFLTAKLLIVSAAALILWQHRHHFLSRLGVTLTSVVYAGLAGIHIGGGINSFGGH